MHYRAKKRKNNSEMNQSKQCFVIIVSQNSLTIKVNFKKSLGHLKSYILDLKNTSCVKKYSKKLFTVIFQDFSNYPKSNQLVRQFS